MKLLALGVFLGAMVLSAADVTGHWSGTFDFRTPDGGQRQSSVYLILKQDGAKVTGTGGRDLADRHDVTEGKIDGNKIMLEVEAGEQSVPPATDLGRRPTDRRSNARAWRRVDNYGKGVGEARERREVGVIVPISGRARRRGALRDASGLSGLPHRWPGCASRAGRPEGRKSSWLPASYQLSFQRRVRIVRIGLIHFCLA